MKQILLMIAVVALVGCGDNTPLGRINKKERERKEQRKEFEERLEFEFEAFPSPPPKPKPPPKLTDCPDCKREVSTRAKTCVHCGAPL
jgi:hypothetical protein